MQDTGRDLKLDSPGHLFKPVQSGCKALPHQSGSISHPLCTGVNEPSEPDGTIRLCLHLTDFASIDLYQQTPPPALL